MNFYYFSVKFYTDNYEIEKENGYTIGTNYSNAVENITNHYGENEIVKIYVEYIADRPILILPPTSAIEDKGLLNAIKENNDF